MESAEQQRKKSIAREEALDHAQYANVMHPRHGMEHEDYKLQDLYHESPAEERAEHGQLLAKGMPR